LKDGFGFYEICGEGKKFDGLEWFEEFEKLEEFEKFEKLEELEESEDVGI